MHPGCCCCLKDRCWNQELREERKRKRPPGPSSGWQCVHKATWREGWGSKKVTTANTCLTRLLPSTVSLLLISQAFSEALTLWGESICLRCHRPCSTSEEMWQRKRPLTGHVQDQVPCAWWHEVTQYLMSSFYLTLHIQNLALLALSELADPGKLTHTDKPYRSLMLKLHDYHGKKRELPRKPKAENCPRHAPYPGDQTMNKKNVSWTQNPTTVLDHSGRPSIQMDGLRDRM